jgi:ribosome-binding ATPase YchF (GTP1/OBG family)
VDKALNRVERAAKANDKEALAKRPVLQRLASALNEGKSARAAGLSAEEQVLVRDLFLLTLKPLMYIANVREDGFSNNPHLDKVRERAVAEGAEVVPICAAIEEELSQLEDADKLAFLADMGLDEPGLNRVIRAGYKLLGLQTYFTAGEKEVRAWTVKKGSTAPQAAGVIHTNFERGFIRAETMRTTTTSSIAVSQARATRAACASRARTIWSCEGDVLHFRFNV